MVVPAVSLAAATNDTAHFLAATARLTERLYRPGVAYHRASVMLLDLVSDAHQQLTLLQSPAELEKRQALMCAIDAINYKWGKGTITYAAVGREQPWKAKAAYRSPSYLTRVVDIPAVR